jgi:transposase
VVVSRIAGKYFGFPRSYDRGFIEAGWKKGDLSLSDHEWRCEGCGMVYDRDINAARNILKVAARQVETENACGDVVRLDPFLRNRRTSKKQEGGISC